MPLKIATYRYNPIFLFFLKIFVMWTILKIFIDFVTVLLLCLCFFFNFILFLNFTKLY